MAASTEETSDQGPEKRRTLPLPRLPRLPPLPHVRQFRHDLIADFDKLVPPTDDQIQSLLERYSQPAEALLTWVELAKNHYQKRQLGAPQTLIRFPKKGFLDLLIDIALAWDAMHPRKQKQPGWVWNCVKATARHLGKKNGLVLIGEIDDFIKSMIGDLCLRYGHPTPLERHESEQRRLLMEGTFRKKKTSTAPSVAALLGACKSKQVWPTREHLSLLEPFVDRAFRAPSFDKIVPPSLITNPQDKHDYTDFVARSYATYLLAQRFARVSKMQGIIPDAMDLENWVITLGHKDMTKRLEQTVMHTASAVLLDHMSSQHQHQQAAKRQAQRRSKKSPSSPLTTSKQAVPKRRAIGQVHGDE